VSIQGLDIEYLGVHLNKLDWADHAHFIKGTEQTLPVRRLRSSAVQGALLKTVDPVVASAIFSGVSPGAAAWLTGRG